MPAMPARIVQPRTAVMDFAPQIVGLTVFSPASRDATEPSGIVERLPQQG
jgi:hypothetical protein